MDFDFNDHIPLCLLQAYRLHRIIKGSFWCILTTRYKHCLYRIDLVYSDVTVKPVRGQVDLEVVESNGAAAVQIIQDTNIPLSTT